MFTNPQRNHPFFIAERTYSYLLLLGVILLNGMSAAGNESSIYSLTFWKNLLQNLSEGNIKVLFSGAGAIIVLAVVIIISCLRWSRTFFSINDDVLTVERKTLFKKSSRLPVGNITTVNIERNVFERVLGVSKVKIDVNSSATADKTDFTFVLKAGKAEEFKKELLRRRGEAVGEAEQIRQTDENAEIVAVFTPGQAIRHKLLNIPYVQIIIALFAFSPVIFLRGEISIWEVLGVADPESVNSTTDLLGIIAALLVIYLIPTVVSVLNYCKFVLKADDNKIYISRGLLKTFNYAFEKNRINAVIIRQSPIARIFGLYSVEVAVVGLGNEKNETSHLCILTDKAKINRVLDACAPDFGISAETISSSKAALVPALFATLIITVLSALLFLYKPVFGILGMVFCAAVGILFSVLSFKTKKLSYNDSIFSYTSGILSKKTVYVKYSDIQSVSFRTNVFLSHFGAGKIRYTILSGQQTKIQQTGWFLAEHFETISKYTALAPDALI